MRTVRGGDATPDSQTDESFRRVTHDNGDVSAFHTGALRKDGNAPDPNLYGEIVEVEDDEYIGDDFTDWLKINRFATVYDTIGWIEPMQALRCIEVAKPTCRHWYLRHRDMDNDFKPLERTLRAIVSAPGVESVTVAWTLYFRTEAPGVVSGHPADSLGRLETLADAKKIKLRIYVWKDDFDEDYDGDGNDSRGRSIQDVHASSRIQNTIKLTVASRAMQYGVESVRAPNHQLVKPLAMACGLDFKHDRVATKYRSYNQERSSKYQATNLANMQIRELGFKKTLPTLRQHPLSESGDIIIDEIVNSMCDRLARMRGLARRFVDVSESLAVTLNRPSPMNSLRLFMTDSEVSHIIRKRVSKSDNDPKISLYKCPDNNNGRRTDFSDQRPANGEHRLTALVWPQTGGTCYMHTTINMIVGSGLGEAVSHHCESVCTEATSPGILGPAYDHLTSKDLSIDDMELLINDPEPTLLDDEVARCALLLAIIRCTRSGTCMAEMDGRVDSIIYHASHAYDNSLRRNKAAAQGGVEWIALSSLLCGLTRFTDPNDAPFVGESEACTTASPWYVPLRHHRVYLYLDKPINVTPTNVAGLCDLMSLNHRTTAALFWQQGTGAHVCALNFGDGGTDLRVAESGGLRSNFSESESQRAIPIETYISELWKEPAPPTPFAHVRLVVAVDERDPEASSSKRDRDANDLRERLEREQMEREQAELKLKQERLQQQQEGLERERKKQELEDQMLQRKKEERQLAIDKHRQLAIEERQRGELDQRIREQKDALRERPPTSIKEHQTNEAWVARIAEKQVEQDARYEKLGLHFSTPTVSAKLHKYWLQAERKSQIQELERDGAPWLKMDTYTYKRKFGVWASYTRTGSEATQIVPSPSQGRPPANGYIYDQSNQFLGGFVDGKWYRANSPELRIMPRSRTRFSGGASSDMDVGDAAFVPDYMDVFGEGHWERRGDVTSSDMREDDVDNSGLVADAAAASVARFQARIQQADHVNGIVEPVDQDEHHDTHDSSDDDIGQETLDTQLPAYLVHENLHQARRKSNRLETLLMLRLVVFLGAEEFIPQ
jgi:hypothetical protein